MTEAGLNCVAGSIMVNTTALAAMQAMAALNKAGDDIAAQMSSAGNGFTVNPVQP